MARIMVTVKSHGVVTTNSARSIKAAYEDAANVVGIAKKCNYEVVGSAPGITMLMCPRHINQPMAADQDFCYIVSAGKDGN